MLHYTVSIARQEDEAKPSPYLHFESAAYLVNSAVNPAAYAFLKSDIKKNLRSMFRCSRGTNELQPQGFHTERGQEAPRKNTM